MRLRICLIFAISMVIVQGVIAQNNQPIRPHGPDEPGWMKAFDQNPVNVKAIESAYAQFYRKHSFEKNTYTQFYKRWMRWVRPYARPSGEIVFPTEAEERQLEEKLKSFQSDNRAGNWSFNGPKETWDVDGSDKVTWQTNVYSIDISTSNPSILYAGGETGGIWKTTNKGVTWTLTTLGVKHGSFGAVKIHPTDPNIVYATTGGKIIKTSDGGTSWNTVYSESGFWGNCIAISAVDPAVVLVAAETGLYRTVNAGTSWTKILTTQVWTVQQKVGDGNTFSLVQDNGTSSNFKVSTDLGLTWTTYSSGWYSPAAGESVTGAMIAVCPDNSSKLYAYLCGEGGTLNGYIGVFKSTDGGANWTNTNPSNAIGGNYVIPTHTNLMAHNGTTGFNQGFYDMAIVANPSNNNELIAGGTSWFKSIDGGATWTALGSYVGGLAWSHPDMQALAANGSDLWITTDGGINYSNDFAASIEARMDGVSGADLWGFDSGWNEDLLVGGRYHNGNMAYHQSFDAGVYYRMGGAEAATGYVNPGPGRKTYHSDIGGYKVKEGFGNDVSYFSVGAWPNESYAYYANSEMVFHPNYYNIVFIGKDNAIWKSTDGGTSYTLLYTFTGNAENDVFDIEIARSNPDVMYCSQWDGSDDAIWKSTDAGASWTKMTALPLPNNNDRIKLAVSSTDANVIWAAVTYGSDGKKIYKSINGAVSWTNLTTSLLNGITVQNIMAQYGTNDGIYLGTNGGVFYRNNTHGNWQPFSTGLPLSAETNRLKPFYRDGKIRNGCWGYGVWESDLFEASVPQAMPMADKKNVGCVRDTVFFDDHSVLNHSGASWTWSFPGASYVSAANIRNPKVVYTNPGNYNVTLSITDGLGQSSSKTVTNMVSVGNSCSPDTIPGKALSLATSSQYGVVNDYNRTNVTELTVTAWVKPNGIQPDYSGIFMNNDNAAGFNFKNGNNSIAYHWPGGQWGWNSNIQVPSGLWSFVAMVVKPTGITLYVNEKQATHNISLSSVDINSFNIGNYQGWSDRTYKGLIDEVAIYNRALTTAEIRNLRHLTKVPAADASLITYYQFNGVDNPEYDKVGTKHISLAGGATRVTSAAPVGAGSSKTINVVSGGLKDFSGQDTKIAFTTSGTNPNGDVVVTKINQKPDALPNSINTPNCYWVINNYGTNSTFAALDSIVFGNSGNILSGYAPNTYELYKRPTYAEGAASWGNYQDVGDQVHSFPSGKVNFSTNNNITFFSQFALMRNSSPLAVQYLTFQVVLKHKKSVLSWSTTDEKTTVKYVIERSTDGETFLAIGSVNAIKQGTNRYNFVDERPVVGINYYRIVEISENLAEAYSNVQSVELSDTPTFTIFPTIVRNGDRIDVVTEAEEDYSITIYDAKLAQVLFLEASASTSFPANFPAGTYFFRIESKQNLLNGKLIVK